MSDTLLSSYIIQLNEPVLNVKNGQKRVLRVQDEPAGTSSNMLMNVGIPLAKDDALQIDMHMSTCIV